MSARGSLSKPLVAVNGNPQSDADLCSDPIYRESFNGRGAPSLLFWLSLKVFIERSSSPDGNR